LSMNSLGARAFAICGSLFVVLLAAFSSSVAQSALPPGTIQVSNGEGAWIAAPPSLPAGSQMMLLEGHPGEKGFFTMRLRLPAGARLQPHWHPRDERVTILSGVVRVGFGDTFDEKKMTTFGAGSFYLNPPKSHHYVWIVEDTEMQLTGTGPWELHLLAPKR
jgi:quercetin dioxygenase-like cupin family protein